MLVATWNVNSVKARNDRMLAFLDRTRPDVLALQELKTVDDGFPFEAVAERGYAAAVYGQKTYNGVAILSLHPLEAVVRGFDDRDDEDPHARLVSATVSPADSLPLTVVSAYFPNGATVGSDKWAYKTAWMARLERMLAARHRPDERLILTGDFNVAPTDADAKNPDRWDGSVLTHDDVRDALTRLRAWGFADAFRAVVPEDAAAPGPFSWWDYRNLGFPKNDGLRIDHVYATAALRPVEAWVDRDERRTGATPPSDHAPVLVRFAG